MKKKNASAAKRKPAKRPLSERRLATQVVNRNPQLKDIRLLSTKCSHDLEQPHPLPTRCEIGILATGQQDTADSGETELVATITFNLRVAFPDESPNEGKIAMEAKYCAVYAIDSMEGLSEDHFAAFISWVGVYNTWPYWREFAQSITTRMGLPGLKLPLYVMGKGVADESQEAATPQRASGRKKTTTRKKSTKAKK